MKLIPHHQGDKHGHREYRSPDGTWKVVRTRRSGGNRNERPRWEVHERHERHADWHCHAAFERRRDALVFLDTTAVTPGGESMAAAKAVPKQRETPERPVFRCVGTPAASQAPPPGRSGAGDGRLRCRGCAAASMLHRPSAAGRPRRCPGERRTGGTPARRARRPPRRRDRYGWSAPSCRSGRLCPTA